MADQDRAERRSADDQVDDQLRDLQFREFVSRIHSAALMVANLRRAISKHFGLSSGEFAVLLAVGTLGVPNIVQIADHLQVSASNVTVDVARLVERGYLQKTPHSSDSRAVEITLTGNGAELLGRIGRVLSVTNRKQFGHLEQSNILMAMKFLDQLILEGKWVKDNLGSILGSN